VQGQALRSVPHDPTRPGLHRLAARAGRQTATLAHRSERSSKASDSRVYRRAGGVPLDCA
jgi:hypothetical protein